VLSEQKRIAMQKIRKILGVAIAVLGSYTIVKGQEFKVGSLHNRQNTEDHSNKPSENLKEQKVMPKANPFEPSASSLSKSQDKNDDKSKEVILASNDKLPVGAINKIESIKANNAHLNKPLVKEYVGTTKFGPVPLAGELSYYKNNNEQMLSYTQTYMKRFDARLSSLRTEKKVNILATIDKILDKHDIPRELKYLAVIESALNSGATSPVGAKGFWQFMEPTGRMMGLKIGGGRDDRTDLTRSTHAAAKYLTYLYDEFEDWLLVVAAYNSGPRPVINAIKKTGKGDFWSIKKFLPKETQNHVMAFVATATIMERLPHMIVSGVPANFDWKSLNINRQLIADEAAKKKKEHPLLSRFSEEEVALMHIIRINKPIDLEVVAYHLGVDRRQLGKWNYDYFTYLSDYKAGESNYNLKIPKDKLEKYLEKRSIIERELLQLN
jgi:membrane-bound lytic murein transglycosylase D